MRSYGTVTLNGRYWIIETEPQVALRLKRVFQKINKNQYGKLSLSASAENSHELGWFLIRYPMEMSKADRRSLEEKTEEHRNVELLVHQVQEGDYTAPEFELALQPREYQRIAADLAMRTGRLLVADDVGLGKTATSICTLTDPSNLPALVVTLAHLPKQWAKEIDKFLPKLRTHVIKKGTVYDVCKGKGGEKVLFPDVLIINYHKLGGWAETLAGVVKTVIYDEVQELRRAESQKYSAAMHVSEGASLRVGLSATPIFNYGGEIFSVMNAIEPGCLGQKDEFTREWCDSYNSDRPKIRDPKSFGSYMREQGLMIRRTRSEVGRELEPLSKIVQAVEADTEALSKIEDSAAELAKIILSQNTLKKGVKMQAAEELSNIVRQATGIAKCLAPGTRVIKYDGTTEAVENLKPGDLLMGPDSKPRKILTTSSGRGEMHEVSSTSRRPLFAPYRVNGDHILALKITGVLRKNNKNAFAPYIKGDHIEISVDEYLSKKPYFHHLLKGFKVGIEFPEVSVPLDPYFLGLWLGDGTSDSAAVTSADEEIADFMCDFAKQYGLLVTVKAPDRTAPTYRISPGWTGNSVVGRRGFVSHNKLIQLLKELKVFQNKHIPDKYLINSRRNRELLLAGLLDTDGHLNCPGCYTISSKWEHLADQICQLAMSLGLASKVKKITAKNQTGKSFPAFLVSVYGNGVENLPLRIVRKKSSPRRQVKDPLRSGIKIKSVGRGTFHGFALDGDGLFLLHDYTVTHNSPYVADFVRMLAEADEPVLLYAWHREVYDILNAKLADLGPVMYTGSESDNQKQLAKEKFLSGESKILMMSLRAGAGLDGLQFKCRTVVFGELDWSPGVHEQCIGRVHRDGQTDPVMAYFLLSDYGSDPVMLDVLGVKKSQSQGIRDPNADLIETAQASAPDVKRLAESFLRQRGLEITEPSNLSNIIQLRPKSDEQQETAE